MPKDVESCVKSVLEDNPEYSESRAYAICHAQQNKGNLSLGDDPSHDELIAALAEHDGECPEGKVYAGDKCVPVTEVQDVPPSALSAPRVLSMRQLAGPIERVENDDGTVTYKALKILSEGVWTDQKSKQPTHYVPKNLEVQEDNTVNVMHDANNDVSDVGTIEPDSTFVEDGDLYADVTLHMENAASEYADENLQTTLESGGEKGFGGPSVEIPADGLDIEKDGELGYPKTASGKINGMGFVGTPAAKTTAFDQQTREREVAMGAGEQTTMVLEQKDDSMSEETKEKILAEVLGRELQVEDIQDDAQNIADELDVPVGEVMEVLDPLLDMDDEEDEEEDTEMEEDDEDPDGDGEDEDNPDEDEEMLADEAVEAIQEQIDDLWGEVEEMKEAMMSESELSDELEDTKEELADAETVEELAEAKEELDKRLSSIEDESKDPRSLAEGNADDWEPEYDNTPSQTSSW